MLRALKYLGKIKVKNIGKVGYFLVSTPPNRIGQALINLIK